MPRDQIGDVVPFEVALQPVATPDLSVISTPYDIISKVDQLRYHEKRP
jgi:hypothetical protein